MRNPEDVPGLAEKDVYYPEKEDVVPDPILNWAIRSAMNKNDEKFVLTREDVASSAVQYIFYESSSNPNGFKNWKAMVCRKSGRLTICHICKADCQ